MSACEVIPVFLSKTDIYRHLRFINFHAYFPMRTREKLSKHHTHFTLLLLFPTKVYKDNLHNPSIALGNLGGY